MQDPPVRVRSCHNPWSYVRGALHSAVPADALVYGLEDVTVPSGKTLTIGEGAALKFDGDDDVHGGGNANLNELRISGTLTVNGSSGDPVRFESSLASPPESAWAGIVFNDNGGGTVSYAQVRNAEMGIASEYQSTLTVSHCYFEHNRIMDLELARGTGSGLTVQNNTLDVGDGIGIWFTSTSANGHHTLTNNALTLDSSTDVGILLSGIGPAVAISGNSVSGGAAAYGIKCTGWGDWLIQTNSVSSCLAGIRAERSSGSNLNGTIGGTGSGSGNTLTDCSTGLSAFGSKVQATVRYNVISDNGYGLYAKGGAYPDVGSGTGGKNTFLDNLYACIVNGNASPQSTLYAQGNYFGDTDCQNPQAPNCAIGLVDLSGVLCSYPHEVWVGMMALPGEPLILAGATPNPMTSGTRVGFTLGREAEVRVEVFDLTGRRIRDLGVQYLPSGEHSAAWDGTSDSGVSVGNGLYFARVTAGPDFQKTAKILVAR